MTVFMIMVVAVFMIAVDHDHGDDHDRAHVYHGLRLTCRMQSPYRTHLSARNPPKTPVTASISNSPMFKVRKAATHPDLPQINQGVESYHRRRCLEIPVSSSWLC